MNSLMAFLLLSLIFPIPGLAAEKALPKKEPKTAVFAGGCFWCMQPPFDALASKGVLSTAVGYSGGHTDNPTYEQTSSGGTGHYEVIEITYDPEKISFKTLLEVFWRNIDPFDEKGQFCDKGQQYASAVFYSNEDEKKEIDNSIKALEAQGLKTAKIATKILPVKKFFRGEEYHQSYYQKNPIRYKAYRYSCGRDSRLKEVWGSIPAPK